MEESLQVIVSRNAEMEKDFNWTVMMETTRLETDAPLTVKWRLDGHAPAGQALLPVSA